MAQYSPPPSTGVGAIGPGNPFSSSVVRSSFERLRRVLAGTVGDYHHGAGGMNILNNRNSLGAKDFQPGALVEVFRNEPFVTGPQNFVEPIYNDSVSPTVTPWGLATGKCHPAGCSISFTPRASGTALIFLNAGFWRNDTSHVYDVCTGGGGPEVADFLDTSLNAYLWEGTNGAEPAINTATSHRQHWRFSPGDSQGRVASINMVFSKTVFAGIRHDYFMEVAMTTRVHNQGGTEHGPAGGLAGSNSFSQFIGCGSSSTVVVIYK